MPEHLTEAQKATLLRVARESLRAAVTRQHYEPHTDDPQLREPGAVFVTLHKQGELRGCIGTVEPSEPLIEAVALMARESALSDFRFNPVTPGEVDEIDIEISWLTPAQCVTDPQDIQVGEHGLIVQQGGRRGLLLPQVPAEWGWDREEFLAHTCLKAGLPRDAWKKGATIYCFGAEVFGEGER